jgi:hypothetical protein
MRQLETGLRIRTITNVGIFLFSHFFHVSSLLQPCVLATGNVQAIWEWTKPAIGVCGTWLWSLGAQTNIDQSSFGFFKKASMQSMWYSVLWCSSALKNTFYQPKAH